MLVLAQQDSQPVDEPTLADEAFSLVQALPIEAHLALGLLLVGGLLLWLFGGKILKPLFGLAGLVVGGMVGLIALPAFGVEAVAGAPGSLIGLAIGAAIGLVVSLIALKAAIVVAAGLGFAAAGFLGGAIYLSFNPLPSDDPPAEMLPDERDRSADGRLLFENPYTGQKMTIDELTRSLRDADSFLRGGKRSLGEEGDGVEAATPGDADEGETEERLRAIAVRCEAIVKETYDLGKSHWNALSSRERVVVAGSTFGGLALGLLIGMFMPKKSAAVITALVGSAVWLTAAGLLLEAFVPTMRDATDQPPAVWAFIWAFTFMVGLIVQLAGLGKPGGGGKKKAKPAEDDGGEDEEE
jgi:hypothetical protein